MEKLDLAGEGGTDFRPAFAYIDELIATHRFTELKGVIYFTDGQGFIRRKCLCIRPRLYLWMTGQKNRKFRRGR